MIPNSSVNNIFLLDIIQDEPRSKLSNKNTVLFFGLCTIENNPKKGTYIEHHEFHEVEVPKMHVGNWHALKKNQHVFVQGRIKTIKTPLSGNSYQYITRIIATEIEIM